MRVHRFICAGLLAAMLPAAALADDPNDPSMRDPAARAADKAMVRRLNLDQGAMVRERDARYAAESRASRRGIALADQDDYAERAQDHREAMRSYARDRAQYEGQMAEWRRAVAACQAGDYSACDN
ncbi:MAG: hypothetical protein M3N34_01130 [Pseudomonadota bacterium]|nr:hypothetical protein [Pseudomonadota bacterium]